MRKKRGVMYAALGGKIHYIFSRKREDEPRISGGLSIYHGKDLDRKVDRTIHVHYYIKRKPIYWFGFEVSLDDYDDEPMSAALWLGPLSIYASFDTPVLARFAKWAGKTTYPGSDRYSRDRYVSFRVNDYARWNLWTSDSMWSSSTPKWRSGSIRIKEVLFGKWKMRWEPVETAETIVPMPEGTFPATVEIRDHVSWFSRTPFLQKRVRTANVEIPGGIGVPGKGENAWDLDADAIFSLSCPAETVSEAVGAVVASVYRTRIRHHGSAEFTEWKDRAFA